jgi:hypothetical protein
LELELRLLPVKQSSLLTRIVAKSANAHEVAATIL